MKGASDKVPEDPGATQRPRVFGIGFHKTGTTSLGSALETLGYSVCHGAGPVRRALGNREMMEHLRRNELDPIFQAAERFDAFMDNPWFCLFREADRRFPGSRFVLTVRDPDHWLRSVVDHFGRSDSDFRRWIYGTGSPVGNEHTFLDRYRRHEREVRAHFAERADDLLVISLEDGDGWEALCAFLGHPVPPVAFPHLNRRAPASRLRRWLQRMRRS